MWKKIKWFVVFLITLPTLYCSSARPLGVIIQGERVEVIDIHLHLGEWKHIPHYTQEELSKNFPFPFRLAPEELAENTLSIAGIRSELDLAGIRAGGLLAVYAPKTVGVTTNDYVIRKIKEDPSRFFGLASIRVDRWNQDREKELENLDNALRQPGMVGIKLAHAHMHFRMDDPSYYGIYKIAAKLDKPIYLHTGPSPFRNISLKESYTNPAYLEDAISSHPNAKFILGHMGHDFVGKKIGFLQDCIRLGKKYKNVYFEPSAFGTTSGDPDGSIFRTVMKTIRDNDLVDRIVYGSDGPQGPGFVKEYLRLTIKAMTSSGYTLDEMRSVLSENFRRIFKVTFEGTAQSLDDTVSKPKSQKGSFEK